MLNDKDVEALLIQLSTDAITYAREEGDVILHYSQDKKLILVEISGFCHLISTETISELLITQKLKFSCFYLFRF
jgi:hypothetical protein